MPEASLMLTVPELGKSVKAFELVISKVPLSDVAVTTISATVATPVPLPAPVAVKTTPTVLLAAPTDVKLVFPTVLMVYSLPTTKLPAFMSAPIKGNGSVIAFAPDDNGFDIKSIPFRTCA